MRLDASRPAVRWALRPMNSPNIPILFHAPRVGVAAGAAGSLPSVTHPVRAYAWNGIPGTVGRRAESNGTTNRGNALPGPVDTQIAFLGGDTRAG